MNNDGPSLETRIFCWLDANSGKIFLACAALAFALIGAPALFISWRFLWRLALGIGACQ